MGTQTPTDKVPKEISKDEEIHEDKSRSQAAYRFSISKFSELKECWYSPTFYVRKLPWNIMVMPRTTCMESQKTMGVFLQCNKKSTCPAWRCLAYAELTLLSQTERGVSIKKDLKHEFHCKKNDQGFSHFIPWNDVLDPEKGYIKDDRIILEVHVVTDPPPPPPPLEVNLKTEKPTQNTRRLRRNGQAKKVPKSTNCGDVPSNSREQIKIFNGSCAGAPEVNKPVGTQTLEKTNIPRVTIVLKQLGDTVTYSNTKVLEEQASEELYDSVTAANTKSLEEQAGEELDDSVTSANTEALEKQAGGSAEEVISPQIQRVPERQNLDKSVSHSSKALNETKTQSNLLDSFFHSIMPHINDFNNSETLEFQMSVLQTIYKIKEKKSTPEPVAFSS